MNFSVTNSTQSSNIFFSLTKLKYFINEFIMNNYY